MVMGSIWPKDLRVVDLLKIPLQRNSLPNENPGGKHETGHLFFFFFLKGLQFKKFQLDIPYMITTKKN